MNMRQSGEKPFALIVEDDRAVSALLRHILDMAGFHTEAVFNGQAALERLRRCQPDLVSLDLNLPGVSGNQILRQIRQDRRLADTKVVVVTGDAHAVGGLPTEPDLVLLKPFSIDQFTSLMRRIVFSAQTPKASPVKQKPLDDRTGLYNQSFFINRLVSSLRQSRENDEYRFAILLFKLEPKDTTDPKIGSHKWELVLREVAGQLRRIVRPTDTLARFDRDAFHILIENVPSGEVLVQIANRIQEILYRNIPDVTQNIRIPIRIGSLLCDHAYENVELILGDASYALMLANAQGDEYSKFYYQVSTRKRPDTI
jgi:diguanylate cyclase (GGDEF)-like protein